MYGHTVSRERTSGAKPIREYYYPALSSTMDVARALARRRAAGEQTFLVRSDHQWAGRGRRGRRWHDEPGGAIMMTVVVRRGGADDPGDANPGTIALRVGLATYRAIRFAVARTVSGVSPAPHRDRGFDTLPGASRGDHDAALSGLRIKWPNDILFDDRKLAGILVDADREFFYIGVGINAYDLSADGADRFDGDAGIYTAPAGALRSASLRELSWRGDVHTFVDACIHALDTVFHEDGWYAAVSDALAWTGSVVTVGDDDASESPGTRYTGRFVGIAADGAAILESGAGRVTVYSGTMRRAVRR